jgi:ParB family chromosome partitioning protein
MMSLVQTRRARVCPKAICASYWPISSFPYGGTHGLGRIAGTPIDLTDEERSTIGTLNAEYAELQAQYEGVDELPDEVDARLGEIEAALAAFDERPLRYGPDDVTRAGVFLSIGADGGLVVDRGYVRPEDESREPEASREDADGATEVPSVPAVQRAVITIAGAQAQTERDDEVAIRPLPDRLVTELTAHRTLALRNAVANNPHVALSVLLHKLVIDTFQHRAMPSCLEATVRHVFFPVQAEDLKDSLSAKAVAERHASWQRNAPEDDEALWTWLDALDEASRLALLAHCVSYGVNALYERADRYGGAISAHGVQQRIAHADRLARAVGLDMAEAGWRPTVANYLGRVSKARILEAVCEAKGEAAAQLIDHLKKGDMTKEAERLLADSRWLPEPLRPQQLDAQPPDEDEPTPEADALPEFLSDDDGGVSLDAEGPNIDAVAAG